MDSDVEMLGSPVLPNIKCELDDEPDEQFHCIVLGDATGGEVEQNKLDADEDKDPMGLLEEMCDNDKQDESATFNSGKTSSDNGSSYKAFNEEESTDKESEIDDTTFKENSSDGKLSTAQKDAAERVAKFAETLPWLCVDNGSPDRVFCLYCFVSLNNMKVNILKHSVSQLHQERTAEYLDFLENAGGDVICLKTNKDAVGDIMKEREKLEEKLADYVWGLWTAAHDWIIRTKSKGKVGYCKYCCTEIHVSTQRLRKAHEQSNRHNEARKKYPQRRKTITGDSLSVESECSDASSDKASEITLGSMKPSASSSIKEVYDPTKSEYFETSKSSADLCRCKLCDITMFKTSFSRHSNSNLHKQNLAVSDNPVVPDRIEKPNWKLFQTSHPWLVEDPNNPMEAFCKYCEKRIMYGTSAAKRLIHEHSAPHKAAVKTFVAAENAKAKQASNEGKNLNESEKENKGEESADEDNDDENESEDGDNESDQEQEDNESESGTGNYSETGTETEPSQKKIEPGVLPSCMKPFQRDGMNVFCRYCKIKMQNLKKTIRLHMVTQRHISNEKIFNQKSNAVKRGKSEPSSYPWLVKFKSNPNIIFCKYCRFRFSAKANRASHQNTRRHIEATKKIEEKQAQEKTTEPTASTAAPLKVVIKRPLHSTKITFKNKVTPQQLKSLFEWVQFKKGMPTNYGYCTLCEKQVFIPSVKYGNRHKRTGVHIRARNELKRQNNEETSATLKRNKVDSDHNQDKNENNNSSTNSSEEPPTKRFKPNSLQKAIQTAKRLTSIHLEMLTFMRNSGRNSGDLKSSTDSVMPPKMAISSVPSPTTSASAIAGLNATLSPIVHAATQANKRDPFDLFFNSISESIKILPPDLASEAKLKVMQVIFELETRAQQRLSQSQQHERSLTPQQPTEPSNTTPNANINGNKKSDIPTSDPLMLDTATEQNEQEEAVLLPQTPDQRPQQKFQQQSKQHQRLGQGPYTVTTTSTPNNSGGEPKKNYIQTSSSNSARVPQRQATNLTPQPQTSSNSSQVHRSGVVSLNSGTYQANTIVHAQCKIRPQQQEQAIQQNNQTPISQRDGLMRHRIVTNKLNNVMSNVNTRVNVNDAIMSVKPSTGLTISSVNSLAIDNQSNSNSLRNHRPVQIRTVPLSSLTKARHENTVVNEPAIHQIQLNSSTQSKIITIDGNHFRSMP